MEKQSCAELRGEVSQCHILPVVASLSQYECCGVHSYKDWLELNTHWRNKEAKTNESAPPSCCKEEFSPDDNCTMKISELNHKVSFVLLGDK